MVPKWCRINFYNFLDYNQGNYKNFISMKENLTCYMCSKPATTKEHVPPKCFFPSTKDGKFRNKLITVPSCKEHNNDTSAADELINLLLYIVTENDKNEACSAQTQKLMDFNSKNGERKKSLINKLIANNPKIVNLSERFKNKSGITLSFEYLPLRPTLISTFNKISCGVYFYTTGKKLVGRHHVIDCIGRYQNFINNMDRMERKQLFIKTLNHFNVQFEGSNPQVFKYRFYENDKRIFFQFVIYEKIEIFNEVNKFYMGCL